MTTRWVSFQPDKEGPSSTGVDIPDDHEWSLMVDGRSPGWRSSTDRVACVYDRYSTGGTSRVSRQPRLGPAERRIVGRGYLASWEVPRLTPPVSLNELGSGAGPGYQRPGDRGIPSPGTRCCVIGFRRRAGPERFDSSGVSSRPSGRREHRGRSPSAAGHGPPGAGHPPRRHDADQRLLPGAGLRVRTKIGTPMGAAEPDPGSGSSLPSRRGSDEFRSMR